MAGTPVKNWLVLKADGLFKSNWLLFLFGAKNRPLLTFNYLCRPFLVTYHICTLIVKTWMPININRLGLILIVGLIVVLLRSSSSSSSTPPSSHHHHHHHHHRYHQHHHHHRHNHHHYHHHYLILWRPRITPTIHILQSCNLTTQIWQNLIVVPNDSRTRSYLLSLHFW